MRVIASIYSDYLNDSNYLKYLYLTQKTRMDTSVCEYLTCIAHIVVLNSHRSMRGLDSNKLEPNFFDIRSCLPGSSSPASDIDEMLEILRWLGRGRLIATKLGSGLGEQTWCQRYKTPYFRSTNIFSVFLYFILRRYKDPFSFFIEMRRKCPGNTEFFL